MLRDVLRSVPGAAALHARLQAMRRASGSPFIQRYPPGHYYSPVPDLDEVRRHFAALRTTTDCPGVDLRVGEQLTLLNAMSAFYQDLPFPDTATGDTRYWYRNPYFSYADAIVLYSLLRLGKPQRIVEVGSGYSSAVMLDTNERFLGNAVRCTFIEPDPVRLNEILRDDDRRIHTVITTPLQQVNAGVFQSLQSGDILFIDSSHVAKVGSDVLTVFFSILPHLSPGVRVHFHDILWPFDYPESWFLEGRAWNEAYFLRAFLQFNTAYEVTYFNSFMGAVHPVELERSMPLCLRDTGGSLWLTRR